MIFQRRNPTVDAYRLILSRTASTEFSSDALIYIKSASTLFAIIFANVVLPVPADP